MKIKLNSIEKVKDFVMTVSRFDEEIDLVSGRYVVDAKSIMGIFSLDLSQPIEVKVGNGEQSEKICDAIHQYVCK